ncbi:MAG: serine O-acetyltransferase EpsC [Lachnospiraceae bacterium]
MIPIICKKEVEAILEELLERYRREKISGGDVSFPESDTIHARLQRQVELAYLLAVSKRKEAENEDETQGPVLGLQDESEEQIRDMAHEICEKFRKHLPDIRERMDSDLEAALDGDPAAGSREEVLLAYPGFMAVMVYRLAHEFYLLGVPILPRLMTEYAHTKTGIDIHPGACIGKSFFIDHGTGVVIGETAKLGEHVKLYQGVTIGALSTVGGRKLAGVKRHPTIEDNVTIYAGATVLGGDTVIGKNSVIGGNTFIVNSVPESMKVYKNLTT